MNENLERQLIIIVSSPSGAGKTTICKKLLLNDENLSISISDTTRRSRANEINGQDYNFISEELFKERINSDKYLEYASVFGHYYGSLKSEIDKNFLLGKDVIFDIDWQGAKQIKDSTYNNILSFFIMPPSKNIIFERLKLRATESGDDEESIKTRMTNYERDISYQREYDHVLINDELDTCVEQISKLIYLRRKINI